MPLCSSCFLRLWIASPAAKANKHGGGHLQNRKMDEISGIAASGIITPHYSTMYITIAATPAAFFHTTHRPGKIDHLF